METTRRAFLQTSVAATLLPTGHVAGVSRTSVTWFRRGSGKAEFIDTFPVSLPSAIACFASHPTRELIVVCRDGFIARVPYPSIRKPTSWLRVCYTHSKCEPSAFTACMPVGALPEGTLFDAT